MEEYFAEILRKDEALHKVGAAFRFMQVKHAQAPAAAAPQAAPATTAAPSPQGNNPTAQTQQDPEQLLHGAIEGFESSPVVQLFMQQAPPSTPGPEAAPQGPGVPGQAVGPQPAPPQAQANPNPGAQPPQMKTAADKLAAAAVKLKTKMTVSPPKAPTSYKPVNSPKPTKATPAKSKMAPVVGQSSKQRINSAKPKGPWKPPEVKAPSLPRPGKTSYPELKKDVAAKAPPLPKVDMKALRGG